MIAGIVTLEYKGEEFTTTDLWGQDLELEQMVQYDGHPHRVVEIEEGDGYEADSPYYEDDELIDGVGFSSEGSALRAATADNPRDQTCPSCHYPNRLTHIDVQRGYQCDGCANVAERGMDGPRNPDCEADKCPLCIVVEVED